MFVMGEREITSYVNRLKCQYNYKIQKEKRKKKKKRMKKAAFLIIQKLNPSVSNQLRQQNGFSVHLTQRCSKHQHIQDYMLIQEGWRTHDFEIPQLQTLGMHTPPSGFCCSLHMRPVIRSFSSFRSPPEKKSAMLRWIIRPSWLSLTFLWLSRMLRGVPSHISFLPFAPTSKL